MHAPRQHAPGITEERLPLDVLLPMMFPAGAGPLDTAAPVGAASSTSSVLLPRPLPRSQAWRSNPLYQFVYDGEEFTEREGWTELEQD